MNVVDDGTIETYRTVADAYYERHGDRSVVADLVDRFLHLTEENAPTARIADVGCGPGWESATFSDRGHDVLGLDLTPDFLELARAEAPHAAFARMDMRALGIDSASIDGLWACASFLHVPRADAPDTLSGFERVLRPGGVLCLSVKRGEGTSEGTTYKGDTRTFVLYDPETLRGMLADAGFDVLSIDTTDEWVAAFARA